MPPTTVAAMLLPPGLPARPAGAESGAESGVGSSAAGGAELAVSRSGEAALLAAARNGEEAALRSLLETHRARVVRLAAYVLRRPDEAEDVAQEAFLRAFRNLHRFRGEGPFSAWLAAITVSLCRDRCRRAAWDAEVPVAEPAAPGAVDPAAAADAHLLVEALLLQLSPAHRAALLLREVEGLEYAEIAGVLRVPVGTVRSRLAGARARFRALWREAHEENPDA